MLKLTVTKVYDIPEGITCEDCESLFGDIGSYNCVVFSHPFDYSGPYPPYKCLKCIIANRVKIKDKSLHERS